MSGSIVELHVLARHHNPRSKVLNRVSRERVKCKNRNIAAEDVTPNISISYTGESVRTRYAFQCDKV